MSDEKSDKAVSSCLFEVLNENTVKTLDADGDEVSTEGIKHKIRRIIDAENSCAPLTDDQIIQIFKNKGTIITRRAVAKYRDQMEIPDSNAREDKSLKKTEKG